MTSFEKFMLGFISIFCSTLLWGRLPEIWLLVIITLIIFMVIYFFRSSFIIGMIAGFIWFNFNAHCYLTGKIQPSSLQKGYLINAEVLSINLDEQLDKKFVTFMIKLHRLGKDHFFIPPKVAVSWHFPTFIPKQGQHLQLFVQLKPPRGYANPYSFQAETYYLSQNVVALANVKQSPSNKVLDDNSSFRQSLVERTLTTDSIHTKWILALALGFRDQFTPDDWTLMQTTATAHLFTISGMHLTFIAGYVLFLIKGLGQLSRAQRHLSHQLYRLSVSILLGWILFGYATLSGAELPVIRAFIAVLCILYVHNRVQHWTRWRILLFVIFCILLIFPMSIYGRSFWLSVSAVAGILFFTWIHPYSSSATMFDKCRYLVSTQIFLSLVSAPLIWLFFSQVSYVGVVINLILIPIVSLVLLPMSILFVSLLSLDIQIQTLTVALDFGFEFCLLLLKLGEQHNDAFAFPVIFIVFSGVFLWLFRRKFKAIYFIFFLLISAVFYLGTNESEMKRFITFDVGHGNLALLQTESSALLFDTGRGDDNASIFEYQVLPYLKENRITNIDAVFVSHFDSDHAGGLQRLLTIMPVDQVISPQSTCVENNHFIFKEDIRIEALWPKNPNSGANNEQSCVLKLSLPNINILLMGDLPKAQENMLLTENHDIRSDILVVGHHGSRSSSSEAFIRRVKPTYAVISTNYPNHWGHPHKEVIEVLSQNNAHIIHLGKTGAAIFDIQDSQIKLTTYRQHLYNRWYNQIE